MSGKELDRLKEAGFEIGRCGGKLAAMRFGGRIIGLYPDGQTNLLWVNPQAFERGMRERWETDEGWPNQGGDRLWVSPEIDTNVGDARRFAESYAVPRAMDPGAYSAEEDGGWLTLASRFVIKWQRSGQELTLRTRREVQAIEQSPVELPAGVDFAGYRLEQRLEAEGELGEARPGIWSIAQIPPGGEIWAATKGPQEPAAFIGKPEYRVEEGRVVTQARAEASFKWSLRAAQCAGKLAYLRELGDGRMSLLYRRFPVGREEEYADCPCHSPEDTGHVCQVYVDDGGLGGFAEMEYHSPAITTGAGERSVSTECETLGFVGPVDAVRELAERLW